MKWKKLSIFRDGMIVYVKKQNKTKQKTQRIYKKAPRNNRWVQQLINLTYKNQLYFYMLLMNNWKNYF